MHADPPGADGAALPRRSFLKLGAAGVAASVVDLDAATVAELPRAGAPPQNVQAAPSAEDVTDPRSVEVESWQEPWIWRPERWPGEELELHVVRNQNAGPSTSPGVQVPTLFSYGGASPGPTIRARGDEVVRVRVRNHMGENRQMTPVGPCPDPLDLVPAEVSEFCQLVGEATDGPTAPDECRSNFTLRFPEEFLRAIGARSVPGSLLVHHSNGQRTAHVTNLHTHGLHVSPGVNPDGTSSDDISLRILPFEDWDARRASGDPSLATLRPHERVGQERFAFDLGSARHGAPSGEATRPHPPGTHWYHPHAHGSTHDQVSSGMAGFFIVEGDVDDAINRRMTGVVDPDPTERTGPFDYRERLVAVQRVFVNSSDLDAGRRRNDLRRPPGSTDPAPSPVILMRPGAVERWRVLNGSVDGSGFKRFMVLDGHFVHRDGGLWRVVEEEVRADAGRPVGGGGGGGGRGDREVRRRLEPVSEREAEAAKLPLHLLAFDGITLVVEESGSVRHAIRDLSAVNAGTENPMAQAPLEGEDASRTMLRRIEDSFRDGDSLKRAFSRPNEVYMANANRADVFFKAPLHAADRVLTVIAREEHLSSDKRQALMQVTIQRGAPFIPRPTLDVVVAHVHVRGEPVEGGDFDVGSLERDLPPVPPFLMPVREDELRISPEEARERDVPEGNFRTRVVSYSGTGGADWPLIRVPESFAETRPELEHLVWARHDGVVVLLPNYTRTMAIQPDLDLAATDAPGLPLKFSPEDDRHARTLLGTAEEWVLYNCSQTLWSQTNTEKLPQPGHWNLHWEAFPLSRAEGQRRNREDEDFRITGKGMDHPFHIHVNPMWVMRIEVPDQSGSLHNVLDEPRWMDTVPIPRNGGRVVFRTRFLDFTGRWVHHCHVLLHEDNGMMAVVECTDRAVEANYRPRQRVASPGTPTRVVDEIYPRPSTGVMYRQNLAFEDPSPRTGQVYPGFELEVPSPPDGDG